jgi:hypothetical protein
MPRSVSSRLVVSTTWRASLRRAGAVGGFLLSAVLLWSAIGAARPAPTLSVLGERTPQGAKLALRGEGWPARVPVLLSASPPPAGTGTLDLGTAITSATGEFRATKLTPCTTTDSAAAARLMVTVTARTADGALRADAQLAASPWGCPPR